MSYWKQKQIPSLSKRRIERTYDYKNEQDQLVFQVVRYSPKGFKQRRPDGKGGWIWNLENTRLILYRLPQVLRAHTILLVEGEKDVETAYQLELPEGWAATTNPMGAGKWLPEYAEWLRNKTIIILPDADSPGMHHGRKIAQALQGIAKEIKGLILESKDLTEWASWGQSQEDFKRLLEQSEPWDLNGPKDCPPIFLNDPTLPPLPNNIFPDWVENQINTVSAHTETPRELAAMCGLGVLAICFQKAFFVQPEPGYREPLNIWEIVAMPSGSRKTRVYTEMTAPLMKWEKDKTDHLQPSITKALSEQETLKLRISTLRSRSAKATKEEFKQLKEEIDELEKTMPNIPHAPRLWAQDITPEKLGAVMADNHEQLGLLSDEGGLFEIFRGRYTNGIPNLDIFLQAHAGSPIRVDRGSRPAIFMQQPALTICISPQPDVLRGLASHPGFRGRGLLARFLILLPSSLLGFRTLEPKPLEARILQEYQKKIYALLDTYIINNDTQDHKPFILQFTDQAWKRWKEFARQTERDMREGHRFENLTDWAGKLPGAIARIAGLLHCAELGENFPEEHAIREETMEKALAFASVLCEHTLAAFDLMGADPQVEAARKVWHWIERNKQARFTARDAFQGLKGKFKRMMEINPAFEVLMERMYIFQQDTLEEGPGRPSRIFRVNRHLTQDWA